MCGEVIKMGFLIVFGIIAVTAIVTDIAIVMAGSIPMTAIITAHIRSKERIKLQLME